MDGLETLLEAPEWPDRPGRCLEPGTFQALAGMGKECLPMAPAAQDAAYPRHHGINAEKRSSWILHRLISFPITQILCDAAVA